jgi:hypothetical protein
MLILRTLQWEPQHGYLPVALITTDEYEASHRPLAIGAEAREKAKLKKEITWSDIEFRDEEIEAAGDAWIQQQIDIRRGK